MPPCAAMHVIGYLFEIGPTQASGMGEGPLMHSEIGSWQRNTGIELSAWEARLLKRLSLDYLVASQAAREPNAAPPWTDAPYVKPAASRVAASLKQSFLELAKL